MLTIRQTETFSEWLKTLKDRQARAKIIARIDRLAIGNAGDAKPVGSGVSELRVNHGAGYRIYFKRIETELVLLICGGDKSTQPQDIKNAKSIIEKWEKKQ